MRRNIGAADPEEQLDPDPEAQTHDDSQKSGHARSPMRKK
jgi:hypothetical protein